MKGFLLIIPFLVIRFGLLAYRNKKAVQRAAYFTDVWKRKACLLDLSNFQCSVICVAMCS